jgi:tetratricopeptide (TPR) repeat protein
MTDTALLEEARSLYAAGRFPESEERFRRLVDDDACGAAALYGLGMIKLSSGDADGAWTFLTQSLDRDPKNPNALYYLGDLAQRSGDHELAISLYGQAVSYQPRHDAALAAIARLAGASSAPRQPVETPAPPPAPPPAASVPAPPPPRQQPPAPQPVAPTRQPEPRSRDSVVGIVRGLRQTVAPWRGKPAAKQVWTFRVETYDENDNPGPLVGVEMRANEIRGNLQDGDWVEIEERARGGGLSPKRLWNHTTSTEVTTKNYWLTAQ